MLRICSFTGVFMFRCLDHRIWRNGVQKGNLPSLPLRVLARRCGAAFPLGMRQGSQGLPEPLDPLFGRCGGKSHYKDPLFGRHRSTWHSKGPLKDPLFGQCCVPQSVFTPVGHSAATGGPIGALILSEANCINRTLCLVNTEANCSKANQNTFNCISAAFID